jgi:hypothetical protein
MYLAMNVAGILTSMLGQEQGNKNLANFIDA